MMFVGLFVTSFAYKFLVFFIFYGLINCEYHLLKLIVYSVRSQASINRCQVYRGLLEGSKSVFIVKFCYINFMNKF